MNVLIISKKINKRISISLMNIKVIRILIIAKTMKVLYL